MESVGLLQFDSLGFDRNNTSISDAMRFHQIDQLLEETQCENNMTTERVAISKNNSKSLEPLEYQRGNNTSFETLYVGKGASSADTFAEHNNEAFLVLGVDSANLEKTYGKSNRIPFLKLVGSSSYDDGDTHGAGSAVDLELFHIFPLDDCTEGETEYRSYSSGSATPQPSLNTQSGIEQKCSTHSKLTEELSSADSHSAGSPLTSPTPPDDEMTRSTDIIQCGSVKKAKGYAKYRLFLKKSGIRMKLALMSAMFGCKCGIPNQVIESAHEGQDSHHVSTNLKISTVVDHRPPDEEKSNASSSTRPHPIEVTLVHSSRQLRLEDENDKALLIDSIIASTNRRLAQLDTPLLRVGGPLVEKRMLVRNLIPVEETFEERERRQLEETVIRVLSQSSRLAIAEMKKSSFSDEEYEDDDSIVAASASDCFPTKQQTFYHDSNGANWTQKQNFCSKAHDTMLGNDPSIAQPGEDDPDRLEPSVIPATTCNTSDQNNNFKSSFKRLVENKLDPVWDKEEIISEIKITGIISLTDDQDSLLAESEDNNDPTEGKDPVELNPEAEDEDATVGAVIRGASADESVSDLSEPPPNIHSPNNVEKEAKRPPSISNASSPPPPPPIDHQGWRSPFADCNASDVFCSCKSEEPQTVNADIIAAVVAAAAAAENQQEHKCISFSARSEMMRMVQTEICMDSCFDTCTSIDTSDDDEDDSSGILTGFDDDEKNIYESERDSVLVSDTGSSSFIS